METKIDIYPNKALEGKGVAVATEAAATEAARVAENRPEEWRVWPLRHPFFFSRSNTIAIPAIPKYFMLFYFYFYPINQIAVLLFQIVIYINIIINKRLNHPVISFSFFSLPSSGSTPIFILIEGVFNLNF